MANLSTNYWNIQDYLKLFDDSNNLNGIYNQNNSSGSSRNGSGYVNSSKAATVPQNLINNQSFQYQYQYEIGDGGAGVGGTGANAGSAGSGNGLQINDSIKANYETGSNFMLLLEDFGEYFYNYNGSQGNDPNNGSAGFEFQANCRARTQHAATLQVSCIIFQM